MILAEGRADEAAALTTGIVVVTLSELVPEIRVADFHAGDGGVGGRAAFLPIAANDQHELVGLMGTVAVISINKRASRAAAVEAVELL